MISVVIPAFNEEKHLKQTLDALVQQQTTHTFEVIVVNNNSTDKTSSVAKSFSNTLPLHIINETKKGRGAARAAGFAKAKGDIILSTDADTTVPFDWIEKMAKHFEKEYVMAVTGTFAIRDCSFFTNTVFNVINFYATYFYRILFGYYWVCGANCAIRKSAYEKAGRFNPTINGMEDVELASRLRRVGTIIFDPENTIIASGRRLKKGLFKGLYDYLKGFIAFNILNKKNISLDDVR